jgi:hypothetical protein
MIAATRQGVQAHRRALDMSSALTGIYFQMYRRGQSMIPPQEVIRLLRTGKVSFVLMGTHGVGGWRSQARATQDVDILVTKRDHAKAVRILRMAFPNLIVEDSKVVTRFKDPKTNEPAVDLMKPAQHVFRMVFRYTLRVGKSHRIPDLEMAIVSKFAAMVSPQRLPEKKLIDGGDFYDIAKTNMDAIDMVKLRKLAAMVYPGAGAEIAKLMNDVQAGRKINF